MNFCLNRHRYLSVSRNFMNSLTHSVAECSCCCFCFRRHDVVLLLVGICWIWVGVFVLPNLYFQFDSFAKKSFTINLCVISFRSAEVQRKNRANNIYMHTNTTILVYIPFKRRIHAQMVRNNMCIGLVNDGSRSSVSHRYDEYCINKFEVLGVLLLDCLGCESVCGDVVGSMQ